MSIVDKARNYLLNAWNNRDYKILEELVDPKYHPNWMLMEEDGPALTWREIKYITSAIPDYKYEIIDYALNQRKVWIWYKITGTHKGNFFGFKETGKSFVNEGATVFTFNDKDMIIDRKGFYCFEDIFRELGLVPNYWEMYQYFENYSSESQ